MSKLRLVIVVSADRSDLYFANQLIKKLNVVGVIVENQRNQPDRTPVAVKMLKLISRPHLLVAKVFNKATDKFRRKYAAYHQPQNTADFGEEGRKLFPGDHCAILYTAGVNDINAPENVEWLREMQPDLVAVCGASIFKKELISIPAKGVLNLHGGLSQYYRGLYTTDWAIYNEQPEYVGATVHYVSPGIDDGDIVYQGRPEIEASDNPNSLYVKVVRLGVRMMERAIRDIENGAVHPTALLAKGDLYLGDTFTSKKRDATWRKLRKGIISEYLNNKDGRDKKVLDEMVNDFNNVGRAS